MALQKTDSEFVFTQNPPRERVKWHRIDLALIWPIAGSHIKRLGLLRVLSGGLSMYLSIPLFLISHVTGLFLMIQHVLTPLMDLPRIRLRDYILIERWKIADLSWWDRFNCDFCGYANGICHAMNVKLEQINRSEKKLSLTAKILITLVLILNSPIAIVMQLVGLQLIYNILVSRPLGMRRIGIREAESLVEHENFAAQYTGLARILLRSQKNFSIRLTNALSQIEAAWCPLKHLDKRPTARFPEHHRYFLEAGRIEEVKMILQTVGTVLPRTET